jgi:hypothetical protein
VKKQLLPFLARFRGAPLSGLEEEDHMEIDGDEGNMVCPGQGQVVPVSLFEH